MRLLLDTHVAIWALASSSSMPPHIRNLIGRDENEASVSVASLWEIAIKFATHGRARMPLSCAEAFAAFEKAGYGILDIKPEHAIAVEQLPMSRGDPFDRLLLAQAKSEPMLLLTRDQKLIAAGGDTVIGW
ncbi:MAG TPA: type II toxin-antitoxin system VapC family toxin [Rhizobiaceae bacterium]|nr:type II toxin-antitoxin system VapC family toxin [Rhizobiaceae bacterium]